MKHEKTFAAIDNLKDVELELHRLKNALEMANRALDAQRYTTPQQQEPRNFCPRCGKRTADLTVIHTCTPPRGLEMT